MAFSLSFPWSGGKIVPPFPCPRVKERDTEICRVPISEISLWAAGRLVGRSPRQPQGLESTNGRTGETRQCLLLLDGQDKPYPQQILSKRLQCYGMPRVLGIMPRTLSPAPQACVLAGRGLRPELS